MILNKIAENIIYTKDLTIGYRTKNRISVIAENINLSVQKGNMICILGKNGIGKSTLLRTLSKVQPKLKGEIYINNQSIESISITELSKMMSLVLTEKIPESNLKVYDLIALGRQPYTNWIGKLTDDINQIEKAIKQTQVEDLLSKNHYELSDGQYQKVMITRSLSQNTEIITLDEPTAHLDILNKVEIFKLLKKLSAELHKTLLISTHEIQLAIQLADELWLMTDDKIICGSPKELIDNGSISNLFESEHIKFDANSKQFIINEY